MKILTGMTDKMFGITEIMTGTTDMTISVLKY